MFLHMMAVLEIGPSFAWAGIADERYSRQAEGPSRKEPGHEASRIWAVGRYPQFAKPFSTDSRATINHFPYTLTDEGSGLRSPTEAVCTFY